MGASGLQACAASSLLDLQLAPLLQLIEIFRQAAATLRLTQNTVWGIFGLFEHVFVMGNDGIKRQTGKSSALANLPEVLVIITRSVPSLCSRMHGAQVQQRQIPVFDSVLEVKATIGKGDCLS